MDPSAVNPFAILTFIAAPAILTNSSSVMALGTSNRFARAIDRARALSAQVNAHDRGADPDERELALQALEVAGKRVLILVRALTAFYLSVGSFAAASLVSLLGAVFHLGQQGVFLRIALGIAFVAGMIGVGGLVVGSALLVRETLLTLRILRVETAFRLRIITTKRNGPGES